ncbi:MAG TPA: HAD-IIA family hydrolase [Polyangia bacterium]|jgi:NagD protein
MIRAVTGFLIDMDGVMYRGSKAIRGAADFISQLQQVNHPFLFLTNNSQRSRRDVCLRLRRMSIRVGEKQIFTCGMATARFLARQNPGGSAYVIGEGGLVTALHTNGFVFDDQKPDYVIVGEGKTLNMEMLEKAVTLINNGARLVATNLDPHCPTETGTRPGCGAVISLLEAATGRKALGIGKPSPITMQEAARELGTAPEDTVVIGDTMDTDILGGVQLGFRTVLVLSGGTKRADVDKYAFRPTYVVNSINDLIDHDVLGPVLPRQPERQIA